jgi:hypothetical protein
MTKKRAQGHSYRFASQTVDLPDVTIHIAAAEANRRGDLLGRLAANFFLALGYDEMHFNIQKAGREIDFEAIHRTENRKVVAEFKATREKIGGDSVNKFAGALDVERRRMPDISIEGYYLSLSGFTETAIEQELDAGNRLVLVGPQDMVRELIRGKICIHPRIAIERCEKMIGNGQSISASNLGFVGHESGWAWLIYVETDRALSHYMLVHSDGSLMSRSAVEAIITGDMPLGHELGQLCPLGDLGFDATTLQQARASYCDYLIAECGEIQLEGLPLDQEVGSRRFELESLYIPVHIARIDVRGPSDPASLDTVNSTAQRLSIGDVLTNVPHLAVLAAPGGGKSTMLKRLATAYADTERRNRTTESLPPIDWLPLFVRCRQLGAEAGFSIRHILIASANRAECPISFEDFSSLVDTSLQSGSALVLIDGLDEISDERARLLFAHQVRVFLATYPGVRLVVTSREAGFRVIAGALASSCELYRIAPFDSEDIKSLSVAWHREVIGSSSEIRSEAIDLARTISSVPRLEALASNPLLLTTLLLVKRWVGRLPTRRTVLYGKAIEVLLMTWNVAGHDPIDQEEAVPQLAFVAFEMMRAGVQQISLRRLQELLSESRVQMPEILGFSSLSVKQFIERVELRSSLLVVSGHCCPVNESAAYCKFMQSCGLGRMHRRNDLN